MSFDPSRYDGELFTDWEKANLLLPRRYVEFAAIRTNLLIREHLLEIEGAPVERASVVVLDRPQVQSSVLPKRGGGLIITISAGLVFKVAALTLILVGSPHELPDGLEEDARDGKMGFIPVSKLFHPIFSDNALDVTELLYALGGAGVAAYVGAYEAAMFALTFVMLHEVAHWHYKHSATKRHHEASLSSSLLPASVPRGLEHLADDFALKHLALMELPRSFVTDVPEDAPPPSPGAFPLRPNCDDPLFWPRYSVEDVDKTLASRMTFMAAGLWSLCSILPTGRSPHLSPRERWEALSRRAFPVPWEAFTRIAAIRGVLGVRRFHVPSSSLDYSSASKPLMNFGYHLDKMHAHAATFRRLAAEEEKRLKRQHERVRTIRPFSEASPAEELAADQAFLLGIADGLEDGPPRPAGNDTAGEESS